MPYHQGAQPAWFAHAMTQALAPIWQDIAQLREDVAQLQEDIAQLSDQVTRVEDSNLQIHRMAAIVESLIPPFMGFFSLSKCRPGTVPVDQVKMHGWRLCSFGMGIIPQLHLYVFLIVVHVMLY